MEILVTKLEKLVLEALASSMYAELGFSDAGLDEVKTKTGLTSNIIRGVQASLVKKGLIDVDDRDGEYMDPSMHIWYLTSKTQGMVKHWSDEHNIEPVVLKER